MTHSNEYFLNLLKSGKSTKKQVAVYLEDETVERIDATTKLFALAGGAKSFSRNALIEEAVLKFLKESEKFLLEEMDMSVDEEIKRQRLKKSDTVIMSAMGRGFEETFMGEKEVSPCWYPFNCSSERRQNLEYIAIYRGAPISAITHYAKIKEVRFSAEKDCDVCHLEGNPVELPVAIELGNKPACYFRGPKYTSLNSLLSASCAEDILFN